MVRWVTDFVGGASAVLIWFLQGFAQITSDHYQYMVNVISFDVTEWRHLDWFASLSQYHFAWEQMFSAMGGARGVAALNILLFAAQPVVLFVALRLVGIPAHLVAVITMLVLVEERAWLGQALFNYSQSLPHFLTIQLALLALVLYLRGAFVPTLLALSLVTILHFSSGLWLGFLIFTVGAPRWWRFFRQIRSLGRRPQFGVLLASLSLLFSVARAASYGLNSPETDSPRGDFNIVRNIRAPWHYNLETTTIAQLTTVLGTLVLLTLTWLVGRVPFARTVTIWFVLLVSVSVVSEFLLLPLGVTLPDAMWPERLLPLFGPLSLGLMFQMAIDEQTPMTRFIPIASACLAMGLLLAGLSISGVASSAMLVVCLFGSRLRGGVRLMKGGRDFGKIFRQVMVWSLTAASLLTAGVALVLGWGLVEWRGDALVFGLRRQPLHGFMLVGTAALFGAFTEMGYKRFLSLETFHQNARLLCISSLVLAGSALVVVPSNTEETGRTVVETTLLDPHEVSLRHFADTSLPTGERYLIPPDFVMFRAVARRAIIVDFKSFPIASSGYTQWSERMAVVTGVNLDRSVPQIDALAEYTSGYCSRGLAELLEVSGVYEAGVIVIQSGCAAYAEASEALVSLSDWRDYSFFQVSVGNSDS